MRLLILLSAMLAGLTGLIAGSPAHAQEPAAIAATVAGAEQAATNEAQIPPPPLVIGRVAVARVAIVPVAVPQAHKVDERRNE